MKLQFVLAAIIPLSSLISALPATKKIYSDHVVVTSASDLPPPLLFPRNSNPTYNGQEIDLPAFITAIFNGLANTILAAGDSAANTIAATGGMLANAGIPGEPNAVANSTLLGRSIGEKVGEKVGERLEREMARRLVGGDVDQ